MSRCGLARGLFVIAILAVVTWGLRLDEDIQDNKWKISCGRYEATSCALCGDEARYCKGDCSLVEGKCQAKVQEKPSFKKSGNGEACATGRITTEAECMAAAVVVGLTWHTSYMHQAGAAGCIGAVDGTNKVFFNTALQATGSTSTNYAEICSEASSDDSSQQKKDAGSAAEEAATYIEGVAGSSSCPQGYTKIESSDSCKDAAEALGKTWQRQNVNSENRPGGCFRQGGPVKYNTNAGRWLAKVAGLTAICKQASPNAASILQAAPKAVTMKSLAQADDAVDADDQDKKETWGRR